MTQKPKDKITKTFNKLKDTGFTHILGSGLINKVLTFLSGIILVRLVPKEEYGSYAYAQNIYNFIMIASGMGLTSGLLQICCEKERKEALLYYNKSLYLSLIINFLLSFMLIFIASMVPLPLKEANTLLQLMGFLPMAYIVFEMCLVYFRYNILNREYGYLSTINTALILIFSVSGAFLYRAKGMILFQYLGYIFTIICAILFLKFPLVKVLQKPVKQLQDWYVLLKISFISMINNAASVVLYNLDIFTLGIMISEQETIASYKIATYIPNALSFIPTSLVIYVYPFFVKKAHDKAWTRTNYFKLLKYFGIFNFVITVLMVVLAPLIIKLVFGEQYMDSINVFRVLAVGYFFNATFRNITGNLLITQRKLNINFWIGILSGVINVIGNLILIKIWGPMGAAVTTLMVIIISSCISVFCYQKVLK